MSSASLNSSGKFFSSNQCAMSWELKVVRWMGNKCWWKDRSFPISPLQWGHNLFPKRGLERVLNRLCISLVPRPPSQVPHPKSYSSLRQYCSILSLLQVRGGMKRGAMYVSSLYQGCLSWYPIVTLAAHARLPIKCVLELLPASDCGWRPEPFCSTINLEMALMTSNPMRAVTV